MSASKVLQSAARSHSLSPREVVNHTNPPRVRYPSTSGDGCDLLPHEGILLGIGTLARSERMLKVPIFCERWEFKGFYWT